MRDADLRNRFYERFSLFARTLAVALSSSNFLEASKRETIERYKKDLKFFQNLRAAVTLRYQEVVDFAEYEPRIKKLIDTHVGAGEVEQLCEPINLLNEGDRLRIIEENGKSPGAKADMIASATRHTIEQEMVIKTLRKGYRITEVPTHEYARNHGDSHIKVSRVCFRYVYSWVRYLLFD